MKKYKVLQAWEGVKVGDTMHTVIGEQCRIQCNNVELTGFAVAVALHLGFIEEVGAVKKERFVPKVNEKYWYVDADGLVETREWKNTRFDKGTVAIGNCYRTEAEALEARERVLKAY